MTDGLFQGNGKITWRGVESLLEDFVTHIPDKNYPEDIDRIIAIARGGLPVAAILGHLMDIKIIDAVSVSTYDNQNMRNAIAQVHNLPDKEFFNVPQCLIVDDIVDTGCTMNLMRQTYPKARTYALVAKPQGRASVVGWSLSVPQEMWVEFPWELKKGNPRRIRVEATESSQ